MSWTKPIANWFKLNIDGSLLGNLGRVSGGGLIKGCGYIARFIQNIGYDARCRSVKKQNTSTFRKQETKHVCL